ncbi:MAG: hypothetical protein NVSMB51_14440 [Solirubrobacteraceae bacterium]
MFKPADRTRDASEQVQVEGPVDGAPAGEGAAAAPGEIPPTGMHPSGAPEAALPAPSPAGGAEARPEEGPPPVAEPPPVQAQSYRDRARLRRRLRYLRQTRELAFRDLGGFVFDQYRFARSREDIVRAKVAGLDAMDRELRALERALEDRRELLFLQEPGISVCPRCGAIHGSDANFCPGCALPRGEGAGLPLGSRPPSLQDAPPPQSVPHNVQVADQPTTELKTPPGASR